MLHGGNERGSRSHRVCESGNHRVKTALLLFFPRFEFHRDDTHDPSTGGPVIPSTRPEGRSFLPRWLVGIFSRLPPRRPASPRGSASALSCPYGSPYERVKCREKVCVAGTSRAGRFTPRSIGRVNRIASSIRSRRSGLPQGAECSPRSRGRVDASAGSHWGRSYMVHPTVCEDCTPGTFVARPLFPASSDWDREAPHCHRERSSVTVQGRPRTSRFGCLSRALLTASETSRN